MNSTALHLNHSRQLNTASVVHKVRGNDLLASWLSYSAKVAMDKYNNLVDVQRFLDGRDEELYMAHSREDESREFDRDRYGYGYTTLDDYHGIQQVDDFRSFKRDWTTMLEENEDNLEW